MKWVEQNKNKHFFFGTQKKKIKKKWKNNWVPSNVSWYQNVASKRRKRLLL